MLLNTFSITREKEIPPETRVKLENEIVERAERTINMIDNLLSWTREQLKGESAMPEKFSPRSLADDILNHEIESRKLEKVNLKNNILETLSVVGDKNVMHLVFRNLINNSLKFTPPEGTIETRGEIQNNHYLFSVKDTGEGISKEGFDKILKQTESFSIKGLNGESGTGLGLMLSRFFLRKKNGDIWFESELNKGTTFYFTLPKEK